MAKTPEAKVKFSIFNEEFNKGIKEITKETSTMRKEFKLQQEQMKHTSTETGKLEHNIKRLSNEKENVRKQIELTQKQLEKAKDYYGDNSEEARKLGNKLLDLQISEKKIENAIDDSRIAINEQTSAMSKGIDGAKKYERELAELGQTATNVGDRLQNAGRGISDFGRNWTAGISVPIIATSGAVFKIASDFESAFAGVEKTVDGTETEIAELRQGIRDMAKNDLPATTEELSAIAASAGQLGIETKNIKSFTRTIADMSESTNMESEEAATSMARLANITGMSQENFDRLGSTTVALGNNLATTEKEIMEMGLRLAGAGKQVGMTEAQTLAFSAALSSVGIEAEAGGSAFSKVMVEMQLAAEKGGDSLDNFAKVAGVSSSDFKKAYEEDAAGAILTFIEGLSTAEERGLSAIGILDEMGITEVRLRDTLLRAAGASDVFSDSLNIGTKAWDENIALTEEAEKRYATTESQLKIMWNRIKDTGITLGEVLVPAVMEALDAAEPFIQKIEDGAQAFADMDEKQQQSILKLIGLVTAIGPASVVLGGLTTTVGGVSKAFGGVASLLGTARGAGLIARFASLGVAGPVGLAIAGVAGLSVAVFELSDAFKDHSKVNLDKIENMQSEIDKTDELIDRFDELKGKNELSTGQMLRYLDVLAELQQTKAPDKIKALKDEQADLLEKSGFTNDEMLEFLGLNEQIVEKSPATNKAISSQGEAYADNTDALKEYNETQKNILQEETKNQLLEAVNEHKESQERLNELIQEAEDIDKKRLENEEARKQNNIDIIKQQNVIKDIEDEIAKAEENNDLMKAERLRKQKEIETDIKHDLVYQADTIDRHSKALSQKYIENQENLDSTREELSELDNIRFKYEEIILGQTGLNSEKGQGLSMLSEEIDNLENQKRQFDDLRKKGELNTFEYQEQVKKIDEQINKLKIAKGELDHINDRAGTTVYKDMYIQEHPRNFWETMNRELSKPVYKSVRIQANKGILSDIGHYATGTNFHPGGPAIVGEQGPELIREGRKWSLSDFQLIPDLSRGAQVFTNDQTKKIISGITQMPAYAGGVGVSGNMARSLEQTANNIAQSHESTINNQVEINVGTGDVIMDGQVAGKILWRPVKENIDRNQHRSSRSPKGRS